MKQQEVWKLQKTYLFWWWVINYCSNTFGVWVVFFANDRKVTPPCSREQRWFSGQQGSCLHLSPPPDLQPPLPQRWCSSSHHHGQPGLAVTQSEENRWESRWLMVGPPCSKADEVVHHYPTCSTVVPELFKSKNTFKVHKTRFQAFNFTLNLSL